MKNRLEKPAVKTDLTLHFFFINNQVAKVLTLKMVQKLSNLLSNLER